MKSVIHKFILFFVVSTGFLCSGAYAQDGAEVHTGRAITILEALNPGGIAAGQELKVAWLDTGEVLDVVIISIRKLGNELELEVMNRESNLFILFEVPADGISDLLF